MESFAQVSDYFAPSFCVEPYNELTLPTIGGFDQWQQQLEQWVALEMQKYWDCGVVQTSTCLPKKCLQSKKPKDGIKKKSNKRLLLDEKDLEKNLNTLLQDLEGVFNPHATIVNGKRKAAWKANSYSQRRSMYIGVAKNGPNWQALISINKRKTYIGTYRTEFEAAMVFDFYSLMLHSVKAKTNFDYSKDQICQMVMNYRENGNNFLPPKAS